MCILQLFKNTPDELFTGESGTMLWGPVWAASESPRHFVKENLVMALFYTNIQYVNIG